MRKRSGWRGFQQAARTIIGLASAASLLVGCAMTEQQAGEAREDKTYMTGSRIPVRDGSTSNSVRSVGSKDAAEVIDGGRGILIPAKGGPAP